MVVLAWHEMVPGYPALDGVKYSPSSRRGLESHIMINGCGLIVLEEGEQNVIIPALSDLALDHVMASGDDPLVRGLSGFHSIDTTELNIQHATIYKFGLCVGSAGSAIIW